MWLTSQGCTAVSIDTRTALARFIRWVSEWVCIPPDFLKTLTLGGGYPWITRGDEKDTIVNLTRYFSQPKHMKAEAPRTHHFVPTHLLGYAVGSFHGFPNIAVSNFPNPEGGDLDLFWRVSGSHTSQVMYCQSDTVPMMNTATHATGQELIEANFFRCWVGMLLKWLALVLQWI